MDKETLAVFIRIAETFPQIRELRIQDHDFREGFFAFEDGKCVVGVGELCSGLEEVMP